MRRRRDQPPGDLAGQISRSADGPSEATEAQRAPPMEGWRSGHAPTGTSPRRLATGLEPTRTQGGRCTPPFPGCSAALAPVRESTPRHARQP